jgi:hypothetical protein
MIDSLLFSLFFFFFDCCVIKKKKNFVNCDFNNKNNY